MQFLAVTDEITKAPVFFSETRNITANVLHNVQLSDVINMVLWILYFA